MTCAIRSLFHVRGPQNLQNPFTLYLPQGRIQDDGLSSLGADDIVQRPFRSSDLKNRVAMAERIISLTSNLAIVRDQLENQAVFDTLTGFMNRAAFFRQSAGNWNVPAARPCR